MNNVKYWEKRAEDKMKAQYKKCDALDKQLKEQYEKALAEIGKNIADFYMRFAKDNNMFYVDATKQLTGTEYNRWRKSIDEYIDELEQMADIEGSESNDFKELLLELNTLAMKSRINRLEGLMMNIQLELANLYQKEHVQVTGLLKDVAEDVYYQTIYNVQVGRGIGHSFSKLDSQTVEDIMNYPWSGDNYSSRIWKQRDKLADTIKQELTQKFIQGKDVRTTAKAIADRMNVNYKNACALVETETCYIAGQTTLKGYKATGMDQYQYLATLDNRTSELCRDEDGKVFNIDDAVVGVNYPPLHVHCRSTTIPYFDDEKGERAARGADGKTYYVSGDMTYKDWYNKYVKNHDNNDIIKKKEFRYPNIKTIKEAENWAVTNLNLKEVSYKGIGLDVANYVNKSMSEIYNEYPMLKGFVQNIRTDGRIKAVASAALSLKNGGINTKLNLSNKYLSDLKSIDEMISICVEDKWWTPKDGVKGIIKHEMGHMIEYALTMKRYGFIDTDLTIIDTSMVNEAFKAINNGEISKDIKLKALSNLKILNTKQNIIDNLSEYGYSNTREFLAEAVSENNPRSLSKETVKLLKEKIKEVWK